MLQLQFHSFKRGSYIAMEGRASNSLFYIIQQGAVECHSSTLPSKKDGKRLGPGDFIGVIPCMSGFTQVETAIALSDVVVIVVRRDQYPELISQSTPVAMKIIRTFAKNMREMNEIMTSLTLQNVVAENPEHIFHVAEYYREMDQRAMAFFAYYQYLKACPTGSNAEQAKKYYATLKPRNRAVFLEPTADTVRTYPADTMIFSECQSGAEMFIIQSGQVKITKVVNNEEVTLAVLKKGDMFGEMALIENKPRSASAVVSESCTVMVVNRKNFDIMVTSQPQLIAKLTTTLAERLWSMYRQLSNTQIPDALYKLLDMLSLQIEKSRIEISPKVSYRSGLTLPDLANMCGIPKEKQAAAVVQLQEHRLIKLEGSKIMVPNTEELIKTVATAKTHQLKKAQQKDEMF